MACKLVRVGGISVVMSASFSLLHQNERAVGGRCEQMRPSNTQEAEAYVASREQLYKIDKINSTLSSVKTKYS